MKKTAQNIEETPHFDVVVIGGGINGAGVARDAAGRGYSVCLCEAGDLAGGTSSASTKLIHGGLRYLEHYEFRLVRESLKERELLWTMAPHVIRPMRFVLPHHAGLRPAWLLRLGLFIYDHLGGRKRLPPTRRIDLRDDPAGDALKPIYRDAFEYSDCWVDDARLVVLNALDAAERGAEIRVRTRVISAEFREGSWLIGMRNERTGRLSQCAANIIVNAAGPWIDEVLRTVFDRADTHNVRLVRGSHIVIPRKFDHDRAYIFQNADDRVLFAIPFGNAHTLIGTTDVDHRDFSAPVETSRAEIAYLCKAASAYFAEPVRERDIVWTYSGVRPLFDDGASKAQEATRDYVLKAQSRRDGGPLINVFGGKLTTYRRLGEEVMRLVENELGRRRSAWTAGAALPGGDFDPSEFDALVDRLSSRFPFLEAALARRLVRLYGTRAVQILGKAESRKDLGRHFGAGLFEAEVRYLVANEWAEDVEDILFRRTKLGLRLDEAEREALDTYLGTRRNS